MARVLTRCPVCEGALNVSELQCGRCKTSIHGAFATCRFCRLAPEHLAFVELYLRCEGNLSRVERELSLSYPTVRNKLQAALTALGFTGEAEPSHDEVGGFDEPLAAPGVQSAPARVSAVDTERRREILEALEQGDLTAEEATEALRELL